MGQDGEERRKLDQVDDDDLARLRCDDATWVRLRQAVHDLVAVGVRRGDFSDRRKTSLSGQQSETVACLIEDRQIVVDVVDVDLNFGDAIFCRCVDNRKPMLSLCFVVENDVRNELPFSVDFVLRQNKIFRRRR